jgi:alpha-1,3-mannosyltransferase
LVLNLCRQSLQEGYRIRVVTLDSLFSDPERPLAKTEELDGIEIVRIPWRGSSRYPLAPSVLGHIADADLVHVHAIDFFFDFLAITSPFHRRKMIATTHGGFFHTRRFAAIKALWFRTLTRFSASRYRYVVGCSQSDTETFAAIAPDRVRMVENGVDTRKFADAASPVPTKRLVTISRFSSNKRFDRLIAMMAALVRSDPDWSLDIIGVGSDLSPADLEAMVAASGLKDHVIVHAGLANTAIAARMKDASFFVSASEYEGFGLVAIEAMSAGLVPILHGNDAYRALARSHADIRLTDFSDAERSAHAVVAAHDRLVLNPAIRQTLEGEAQAYSWDKVAERYFALYRDVLGEGAHP